MKDIRFKVWDKEDKVLGIVNDIDYLKKLIHLSVAESGRIFGYWQNFRNVELLQYTGQKDKNDVEIFEGDITELIVSGNDRRRFVVSIEKVVREVVNHPDFAGSPSKVEIMGVVFKWEDYELFPMLDENGRSDVSRMRVIGNIYENPELIKGS